MAVEKLGQYKAAHSADAGFPREGSHSGADHFSVLDLQANGASQRAQYAGRILYSIRCAVPLGIPVAHGTGRTDVYAGAAEPAVGLGMRLVKGRGNPCFLAALHE